MIGMPYDGFREVLNDFENAEKFGNRDRWHVLTAPDGIAEEDTAL